MHRLSRYTFPIALAAFIVAYVAVNWPDIHKRLVEMRYGPWVCEKCEKQAVWRTANGGFQCIQCGAMNSRPPFAAD